METAKIVTTLLLNLALFSPCLSAASSAFNPTKFGSMPIRHDYTRFADVERHCQSVLSSAADTEIRADVDHGSRLLYQLSFINGDWSQDAGQAPLLPFHGSYADPAVAAGPDELLQAIPLASFRLTHVETLPRRGRRAQAAFNVSGLLGLTIARNRSCSSGWSHMEMEPNSPPEFELQPGIARLHLLFQGVYTESTRSSPATSGGETVLCMVGEALLPVRGSNKTDPWEWAKNRGGGRSNLEPPVVPDGNILLVLRYPKTPTLTNRAVHGVMMSTNAKSDGAYFDTIHLVSQLSVGGYGSDYQFQQDDDAEASDVAWCGKDDESPFHGGDAVEQHLSSGDSPTLCDFIHESNYNSQLMEVVPNWNCKGTDEFCSQVGPFVSRRHPATSRGLELEDMAFTHRAPAIAVTMGSQCRPLGTGSMDGRAAATVAAVFRYVPPWEHQPTAAKRTGMSSMTLSAEGVWIPSMGRVCMVGCLGVGGGKEACGYHVSLSVRTTMSLTRRGIIAGQITAMDGRSHPPLLFHQRVEQHHPLQRHVSSYLYTKVQQAQELLLRLRASQPAGFRNIFAARSLLSFPNIAAGAAANDEMLSLANLADDLDLRFQSMVKPPFVPQWIEGSCFGLQILSMGTMVGRDRYRQYQAQSMPQIQLLSRVHGVEKQHIYHEKKKHKLLNVSAEFMASSKCLGPSPVMSLEGVYNPEDGRMYLIGCRSVHAPRRLLPMIRDLEDEMDCSIEVTVEYPPTTTRWLISRQAKVLVASTRDDGDPLHFNRSELHSLPVIYRDQRQHERTEPIVEELLCVTMLSATIVAAIRQLRYIKSHADVAPYISLAMLGVQALGYTTTLVTDAKMLPAWPSQMYGRPPHDYHMGWNILECSVKVLTLVAFAITARLAQKVWRSRARARARARAPLEQDRVPNDTMVLLYSFGVHLGTLFFFVAVNWLTTDDAPGLVYHEQQYRPLSHIRARAVMERYIGVVKEWFLLPQVIGNVIWRLNCKPLAAGYYAGVTAVWLLPRIYRYLRPPVVNMYAPNPHADVMGYYKDGNVVIPLIGVLLALVVYVQQRWNYKIIGWAMKTERNKLQHAC